MLSPILAVLAASALAKPVAAEPEPALPPAEITLRVDVPDLAGPWRIVVTNEGAEPVRLAADGRLLRFEIKLPPKTEPEAETKKLLVKRPKEPAPVVCELPPSMRPAGVSDDRAVILRPGARYEEVVSPALYCFGNLEAAALVAGSEVTAHLGFAPPTPRKGKIPKLLPPFIAEPTGVSPAIVARKELVSSPFVLPAEAAHETPTNQTAKLDAGEPNIEMFVPQRVDTPNERTVGMTVSLKNTGKRPAQVHLRRDNVIFDVDGPDGSTRCGQPTSFRTVPADMFSTLLPNSSRSIDVWIGEMCPDVVFDRPGLYRVRAWVSFPNGSELRSLKSWTQTVVAKDPILIRVREGRLPFYSTPPQVLGGGT